MPTLGEARVAYAEVIKGKGGRCPCCSRFGKVHSRQINRSMAKALLWLSRQTGDEDGWVNVPAVAPRWLLRTNQHTTLSWWGLIERKPNTNPKTKHSGVWRVTPKGRAFADFSTGATVPKKVFTFGGKIVSFSTEERTTFAECFGRTFDYSVVMSEVFQ